MGAEPNRRRAAAEDYVAALTAFGEADRQLRAPEPPWFLPHRRITDALHRRRSAASHSQAAADARVAARNMAYECTGAGPRWGVLSGGTGVNLEWALDTSSPVDPRCAAIAEQLPLVRAETELSLESGRLPELVDAVAALAVEYPLLREFLPAAARPPAQTIRDLDRHTLLLKFSVDESDGTWGTRVPHITLHDIVSLHPGRGIGTEALVELCDYADRRSLPIIAEFIPDGDDESAERAARWYRRHGFEQAGQPASWTKGAAMRRDPGAGQC